MRQLGDSNHKDMSAYLMDFGFGGYVGYGGGMPIAFVKEELDRCMKDDVRRKIGPA